MSLRLIKDFKACASKSNENLKDMLVHFKQLNIIECHALLLFFRTASTPLKTDDCCYMVKTYNYL